MKSNQKPFFAWELLFATLIFLWGIYQVYHAWFQVDYLHLGISILLLGVAWIYSRRWRSLLKQKIKVQELLRGREERLREAEVQVRALYQSEYEQRCLAQMLGEVASTLGATLNFDQVLDRLLEQIERVVPFDTASVLLVDGDTAVVARTCGFEFYNRDFPARLISRSLPIKSSAGINRIYETRKPLVIPDVSLEPDWITFEEAKHIRSWAGAPIIAQGQVIAIISLDKAESGGYRQKDAELLTAFSGHAALAMQNALFFEATQKRANEAETLRQASIALLDTQSLGQVLDTILTYMARVVQFDNASIFLLKEGGLLLAATQGSLTSKASVGKIFPKDDSLFSAIASMRKPLILADAQLDPRFQGWGDTFQVHGWIGAPFIYNDQLIGYLTIDSLRAGAFIQANANMAQIFANQSAIAIQNVLLFEQVQHLAITDPLTGLFDRQYFFEVAEREFQRSQRYGNCISLIIIDLDFFKNVNDTYGHLVGDEVLRRLSKQCLRSLREVDTVARYGGEEFVVLMPETPLPKALQVVERIRDDIAREPFHINGLEIPISASIGVASRDDQCKDLESLMSRADLALYSAKNSGRGKYVVWSVEEEQNGVMAGIRK